MRVHSREVDGERRVQIELGSSHRSSACARIATGCVCWWRGATAEALVLQPDSKLVVAGRNLRRPAGFVLHRYRSNCSPDASFGSRGRVITPTRGGEAVALAIQPD